MKRCKKCHEMKPLSSFYISRITADGYYWYCKKCEVERARQRYREIVAYKKAKEEAAARRVAR